MPGDRSKLSPEERRKQKYSRRLTSDTQAPGTGLSMAGNSTLSHQARIDDYEFKGEPTHPELPQPGTVNLQSAEGTDEDMPDIQDTPPSSPQFRTGTVSTMRSHNAYTSYTDASRHNDDTSTMATCASTPAHALPGGMMDPTSASQHLVSAQAANICPTHHHLLSHTQHLPNEQTLVSTPRPSNNHYCTSDGGHFAQNYGDSHGTGNASTLASREYSTEDALSGVGGWAASHRE